jgi:hypothetical protein
MAQCNEPRIDDIYNQKYLDMTYTKGCKKRLSEKELYYKRKIRLLNKMGAITSKKEYVKDGLNGYTLLDRYKQVLPLTIEESDGRYQIFPDNSHIFNKFYREYNPYLDRSNSYNKNIIENFTVEEDSKNRSYILPILLILLFMFSQSDKL